MGAEGGRRRDGKWERRNLQYGRKLTPQNKMWINNLRDLIVLVRRKGKGTNDENDHLRNKNLRKSIIDNKNTEKRIFVWICFSFYVFKRKEVGGGREYPLCPPPQRICPSFWLWEYLIKVIPNTRSVHYMKYLRLHQITNLVASNIV